jgi:hypothetical protein
MHVPGESAIEECVDLPSNELHGGMQDCRILNKDSKSLTEWDYLDQLIFQEAKPRQEQNETAQDKPDWGIFSTFGSRDANPIVTGTHEIPENVGLSHEKDTSQSNRIQSMTDNDPFHLNAKNDSPAADKQTNPRELVEQGNTTQDIGRNQGNSMGNIFSHRADVVGK